MSNAMKLLLINLLIVLGATIWIALTPEPTGAAGVAHDSIAGMRKGGDGSERFGPIFAPVLVLQYGTLSAISSLILLPLWRGAHVSSALAVVHGVWGLSILVWLAIAVTYDAYWDTQAIPYVLGFPLPSALAVYGVWAVGLLLTFFYVFGFERFVYTAHDRKGFEALVEDMRAEDGE